MGHLKCRRKPRRNEEAGFPNPKLTGGRGRCSLRRGRSERIAKRHRRKIEKGKASKDYKKKHSRLKLR